MASPGTGARGGPGVPLAAERAWGERAAELVLVVRAVLAATLRLPARDPTLDDLTQEVLRRALDGRERARADAPVRPWLLGIARHVAVDEQRRRARLASLDEVRSDQGGVDAIPDPMRGPEELTLQAEDLRRLKAGLAELPESWRRALLLFHVEELSYQQIARELRAPMGTVATWIARGRAQLLASVRKDPQP